MIHSHPYNLTQVNNVKETFSFFSEKNQRSRKRRTHLQEELCKNPLYLHTQNLCKQFTFSGLRWRKGQTSELIQNEYNLLNLISSYTTQLLVSIFFWTCTRHKNQNTSESLVYSCHCSQNWCSTRPLQGSSSGTRNLKLSSSGPRNQE